MASSIWNKAREVWLNPTTLGSTVNTGITMSTDTIKVALAKASWTPSVSAEDHLDDISSQLNSAGVALSSKTVTDGVFDAADHSAANANQLTATAAVATDKLVIYKDSGTASTSLILCWIEVTSFTPSASQLVNITWDNGANKIFKL